MTWRIVHDSEHGIWLDGPMRREPSIYPGMTYPVRDRMTFTRPKHIQVMRAEDIVAMAKDAARYRHLRAAWPNALLFDVLGAFLQYEPRPEDVDRAVDGDMKEQEK